MAADGRRLRVLIFCVFACVQYITHIAEFVTEFLCVAAFTGSLEWGVCSVAAVAGPVRLHSSWAPEGLMREVEDCISLLCSAPLQMLTAAELSLLQSGPMVPYHAFSGLSDLLIIVLLSLISIIDSCSCRCLLLPVFLLIVDITEWRVKDELHSEGPRIV